MASDVCPDSPSCCANFCSESRFTCSRRLQFVRGPAGNSAQPRSGGSEATAKCHAHGNRSNERAWTPISFRCKFSSRSDPHLRNATTECQISRSVHASPAPSQPHRVRRCLAAVCRFVRRPVPSQSHYTFEEVPASSSGITWVHTAGKSADKHLPETSGAGCAFLDFDNDGWMDIYLVNSGKSDFYNPPKPLRNALYRNNRDGTFTDVTERAGVSGGGYGMGVAVGDYNGDGFPDLYVTQFGRNILYRNNGDGTFTDVTEKAGVAAAGWSSSAVWFDYDNDGKLDLFVCQFAEFDASLGCGTDGAGVRHYCIPRIFKPRPSWLFHNNGDGTFTDVSNETGIASHLGKAWGVVATDVNNDGKMDLFVANDTVSNFLFMNRGRQLRRSRTGCRRRL